MKKILTILALGMSLTIGVAHAADAAAPTAQQNKMKTCNEGAMGKVGEERKAYMKECLSAKPAAAEAPGNTQQNKMKTCNAEARGKTLSGEARKTFMKECLSSK